MKRKKAHPEDFSPYLDRETSDPRYAEILAHVGSCDTCRGEVGDWEHLDSLFRSPDVEIEVPPFQWQRIAARLSQEKTQTRLPWFPWYWKPVLSSALASVVLGAAVIAGLVVNRHFEEKHILSAVARYAQEEGKRIGTEKNPFWIAASADNNPFFGSKAGAGNHPTGGRR